MELRVSRLEALLKEVQEGSAQFMAMITGQLEHIASIQHTQETILTSHTSRIIRKLSAAELSLAS